MARILFVSFYHRAKRSNLPGPGLGQKCKLSQPRVSDWLTDAWLPADTGLLGSWPGLLPPASFTVSLTLFFFFICLHILILEQLLSLTLLYIVGRFDSLQPFHRALNEGLFRHKSNLKFQFFLKIGL